jgi:DNA-binding CsgD family transcriptional regulator
MSHRGVELVIGKLMTDEEFRRRFSDCGHETLHALREHGIDLDPTEIGALLDADPDLWSRMATWIDRRLRADGRIATDPYRPLTARQCHVLREVRDGSTNKQIAATLGVSESSVKATIQQLFQKTRVRTRTQLVRVAMDGCTPSPARKRR